MHTCIQRARKADVASIACAQSGTVLIRFDIIYRMLEPILVNYMLGTIRQNNVNLPIAFSTFID